MTEQAVAGDDPLVFTTAAAKKVADLIAEEGNPEMTRELGRQVSEGEAHDRGNDQKAGHPAPASETAGGSPTSGG